MEASGTLDPLSAVFAIAIGLALIGTARWASRKRGSTADTWVALRVGDVLLTETIGAFIVGFAIGVLVAPPDETISQGPPRRFGGRFGGFGGGLPIPLALGVVAAAVTALMRIDLNALVMRGRPAPNTLSTYIGWEARVVAQIPAGGFGEIAIPDGRGNLTAVAATADTDIIVGRLVRVTGTRGLNLVVAPLNT